MTRGNGFKLEDVLVLNRAWTGPEEEAFCDEGDETLAHLPREVREELRVSLVEALNNLV